MSTIICNAPFCQNIRNYNHAWCPAHRWEREKYKVKVYKEVLPLWAKMRCKTHGLLRIDQCSKKANTFICKACNIIYQKKSYNPEKQRENNIKYFLLRKDWRLKKRYNISIKDYEEMLKKQNSSCAICSLTIEQHQKIKGERVHFAVDHCHKTNKVRGLLCYRCNIGLGYFQDNPEITQAATNYLYKN